MPSVSKKKKNIILSSPVVQASMFYSWLASTDPEPMLLSTEGNSFCGTRSKRSSGNE
jgi:hypothetical protein